MLTHHRVSLLLLMLRLLFHAAGAQQAESRRINISSTDFQAHEDAQSYPEQDQIQRFMCPAGFFRLRRNCYYLSAGTTNWKDAHFQCVLRNSTLAVLNRQGKDKMLRKYLLGDQFKYWLNFQRNNKLCAPKISFINLSKPIKITKGVTIIQMQNQFVAKLERWIGGIYNWRQMNWHWGVTGDKVLFQSFGNLNTVRPREHDCLIMDPELEYKWNARKCFENKYFICETPAGKIGKSRRRKNINDLHAPQNQRVHSTTRDERKRLNRMRRKNKVRSMGKNNWQDDHQIWANGIKPGSRPPKGLRRPRPGSKKDRKMNKRGHRRGHKQSLSTPQPRIYQASPGQDQTFGAFPVGGGKDLQSLSNDEVLFPPPFDARSVFTREEVLLKT